MKLSATLFVSLLLLGCARAGAPDHDGVSAPAVATSTVGKALAGGGVTIAGKMDAPAGYQGYVGNYQGRKLPVYVLPDGKHLVVGTLLDLQGHDLTSPAMREAADAGFGAVQWRLLQQSAWFTVGNPDAKRVVYAFMDTECPYCHKLWQAAQPWIEGGKVDLRIITVAVISPRSLPRGAAILGSGDPAAAWRENEKHFGKDQAAPQGNPAPDAVGKIRANNALMDELGFYGTPGVVYKDAQGHIHTLHGLPPDPDLLKAVFEG